MRNLSRLDTLLDCSDICTYSAVFQLVYHSLSIQESCLVNTSLQTFASFSRRAMYPSRDFLELGCSDTASVPPMMVSISQTASIESYKEQASRSANLTHATWCFHRSFGQGPTRSKLPKLSHLRRDHFSVVAKQLTHTQVDNLLINNLNLVEVADKAHITQHALLNLLLFNHPAAT